MILIKVPVSRLIYCVTAEPIIETHLVDKFFPFVCTDDLEASYENPTLFIDCKSNCLEVHYGSKTNSFKVNSCKDAYLKIIDIIREHIVFHNNLIALHGATIDYLDKRFVFLASSGTGKSVLTAFLSTKSGFKCCSDDVIYIDCVDNNSVAYSKYIYLRPSAQNIDELDKSLFKKYDEFVSRFLVQLEPTNIETKRRIERFVVLSRESVDRNYITKCVDPFNALLYNLFFTHQIRHSLRQVARLSTTTAVDILHYNNLETAHLCLKEHFRDTIIK